ncbi:antA/AntB antirepressor family protein [Aggregatibacter actinomycetemcomitans]|uniref:antA/AntB antirepressor family protein n=1 Tax=Aggregatibacter actinomycetemcomitans TaxID=714 RepID=UPI00197B9F00|nr:antA/AntB antirepressor family protein [Aggregatibacter actinomycetemcomitans]MBN6077393.1 antA/AntB antirepressor family protein [Aggregatibacter actinomycetemcomitans]
MKNLPINTFTDQINNHTVELISAREVHDLLQVKTPFHKWIARRLSETRFRENLDFIGTDKIVRTEAGFFGMRDELVKEYHLTLRMAEYLCLMENNDIGDRIRDLFIEREEQARCEIPRLQAENAQLTAKLTALSPANAVSVSKDRYIELLENENRLLRTQPNPLRKKASVPLSAYEKQRILTLHAQGVGKADIALQLNRSRSAVRAVIREAA